MVRGCWGPANHGRGGEERVPPNCLLQKTERESTLDSSYRARVISVGMAGSKGRKEALTVRSDRGPDSDPSAALAPLRENGFRVLWTASLFSNLGEFFQITAGSWLMWELTSSPAWVGWMTASRNLPLLLLALPAGVLADRLSRGRVLAVTQIAMGLVAASMAILDLTGLMTAPVLLALGLLLGVGVAFHATMWFSFVPDLVPRSLVTSAVALDSVSLNAARAVGPALAGVIIAAFGAAAVFGLNAASYGLMFGAVLLVGRGLGTQESDGSSVARAVLVGVRFARHTRSFQRVLAMGASLALSTAVFQAMLPVRTEELGQDASAYGLLFGMMGAGAALGGMTVTRANQKLKSRSIPATVILTGVVGVAAGAAPTLALTALAMFVVGITWIWTLANLHATVQLLSPDWVRGRAVSLWLLSYAGMVPVGAILAGVIAEQIGAGATMIVLSVVTISLGVGAGRWRIQDPSTVRPPEFTARRTHHHPPARGGPVMVVNTWRIVDDDLPEFLSVMREVRAARMTTGGSRWQLYREVGEAHTYSEAFVVASWEEHLLQHQRIDDRSVAIIARARSLDMSEHGPTSRHYLGVDIDKADLIEVFDDLAQDHQALHSGDGSVPLGKNRRRDVADDDY